ncbi:MAG: SpoIIE family protein phosphatase [Bacteroidaceae bacterium]|nr:SpoIIE family protein phosphatase [Bacteroidaceae bacterium]
MKNPITYIRKSLSTRLSLLIVLFSATILVAALGFLFEMSSDAIRQEAISRASQSLESTALRVQGILERVEVATENTEWLITRHLDGPDSMFVYSRRILENNPDLNGCSIAFEPEYFKEKGRWFSAYSLNDHGNIRTIQEGNQYYEYFYMDWYQLCKLLDRPVWTEPFMDYNPEGLYSAEMITSYCKPIKDREGNYIGTMSVDLSLNWLSQTISAVKPYPNSYSIMIGRGGTFFVHPDTTKLLYQTIFTETLEHEDKDLEALGHAMLRGEEGMKQLKIDGEDCYVFYKPLGETGWSTAIVCPESDIFGGFNRIKMAIILAVCFGLLLILAVSFQIITRELKPLNTLARQAETIAGGDFNETLPENNRIDEIGQLTRSFGDMQHSLVSYIDELKTTTAQKASIENELKVASDIQMSMVPRLFPAFPNRKDIDLYASMTPAKEVGGDLYDFFIQDEQLYFCVGDVSGKGIPASLFMAITRNMFRIIAQQGHTPVEIATQINTFLSKDNDKGMFVTMFIGMADLRTGRLDYCNCGHNAPILDGQFMHLEFVNQPLGLWEDDPFYGESIDDIRGKQLLVYTDGLNEAENPQKQLLGNKRVIEIMADITSCPSEKVINILKEAVEKHRAGAAPNDDLTLLCLNLKPLNPLNS